jgi:hypothetical protein
VLFRALHAIDGSRLVLPINLSVDSPNDNGHYGQIISWYITEYFRMEIAMNLLGKTIDFVRIWVG